MSKSAEHVDIKRRLASMKKSVAQLEDMFKNSMASSGTAGSGRGTAGSGRGTAGSSTTSGSESGSESESESGSEPESASAPSSPSPSPSSSASLPPPKHIRLPGPVYVGHCPTGTAACDATKRHCPADLSTNIYDSKGNECMSKSELRRLKEQLDDQKLKQSIHVVHTPKEHTVQVPMSILRDISQNAAIINSRLLSISRANVSCSSVNRMVPDDANVEDRRAFCNTLMTSDNLQKCELDEQNRCIDRDLALLRQELSTDPEMTASQKEKGGIINQIKNSLGKLAKMVTSPGPKNPLRILYKNGHLSYSTLLALAAIVAKIVQAVRNYGVGESGKPVTGTGEGATGAASQTKAKKLLQQIKDIIKKPETLTLAALAGILYLLMRVMLPENVAAPLKEELKKVEQQIEHHTSGPGTEAAAASSSASASAPAPEEPRSEFQELLGEAEEYGAKKLAERFGSGSQ